MMHRESSRDDMPGVADGGYKSKPSVPRATLFWSLVVAIGMCAALLVVPITEDPEQTIFTRADNNTDPVHLSAVVSHGIDKLLSDPLGYYSPPYLYPDPNSLRSITTFLSETLLALPIRIVVGDRPLLYTALARFLTVVLSALFITLMLRELGLGRSMALAGGPLSVLLVTYGIFIDRIQSLSLQWLALALFFAVRICRGKKVRWSVAGLIVSLFLLVHASIYTSVMLLAAAPFLLPLLFSGMGSDRFRHNIGVLALATLAAALVTGLSMAPWLFDRWDMGVYSQQEFMEVKRWHAADLGNVLLSPPELEKSVMPFMPAVNPDGYYPGHALVLALLLSLALPLAALFVRRKGNAPPHETASSANKFRYAVFRLSSVLTLTFGWMLLAVFAAWLFGLGPLRLQGVAVDLLIWGLLISWLVRLSTWSAPWRGGAETISFLASTALLLATVLFLLALGSPIKLFSGGQEIATGIFGFVSQLIPPLSQLRAVKRIIPLAGWFFLMAIVLRTDLGARRFPRWIAAAVSALLVSTAAAGWLGVEFGIARSAEIPEGYGLLRNSAASGGLLELPMSKWNSRLAVYRMIWQRKHGRPIVDGVNSQAPPWFGHARDVFNSFPSRECLWLIRRWNIDSALVRSPFEGLEEALSPSMEGIVPRGRHGAWTLFDIESEGDIIDFRDYELAESLPWEPPKVDLDPDEQRLLTDERTFVSKAVLLEDNAGLGFEIEAGGILKAVLIDYGYALGAKIPSRIEVQGYRSGRWRNLTFKRTGSYLRARAADLLLRRKPARLVIVVRPSGATRFRLKADKRTWHLPEMRISID